jgi:hypothetical protein
MNFLNASFSCGESEEFGTLVMEEIREKDASNLSF